MNLGILRKIKHNNPRRAPFCKTVVKAQNLQEVITEEILEAASAENLDDTEDLDQIINDVNGRIRIKTQIRHDNRPSKTFRKKPQILFFGRNPVLKCKIKTLKIKTLRIETHSLRIQIFNHDHPLKSLLQILYTCLIHNRLRLCVNNVAILIT